MVSAQDRTADLTEAIHANEALQDKDREEIHGRAQYRYNELMDNLDENTDAYNYVPLPEHSERAKQARRLDEIQQERVDAYHEQENIAAKANVVEKAALDEYTKAAHELQKERGQPTIHGPSVRAAADKAQSTAKILEKATTEARREWDKLHEMHNSQPSSND
jgi:hypothetical protein